MSTINLKVYFCRLNSKSNANMALFNEKTVAMKNVLQKKTIQYENN